jgi:hypothetical protein
LILGRFVLVLTPTTILILLGVPQARRFTAALDAEDIARLCPLLIWIRPVGIRGRWIWHESSPLLNSRAFWHIQTTVTQQFGRSVERGFADETEERACAG